QAHHDLPRPAPRQRYPPRTGRTKWNPPPREGSPNQSAEDRGPGAQQRSPDPRRNATTRTHAGGTAACAAGHDIYVTGLARAQGAELTAPSQSKPRHDRTTPVLPTTGTGKIIARSCTAPCQHPYNPTVSL